MGDTDTPHVENQKESSQNAVCDISKPSIDILKEAKPSENISISDPINENDSSPIVKELTLQDTTSTTDKDTLKVTYEIKAKKLSDDLPNSVEELKNVKTSTNTVKQDNDNLLKQQKDKTSLKNRSDIFSLNENKTLACTIFSVGGAPAKTIHQTLSVNSSNSSNDTIGSASSKMSQLRNPLTGIGVNSNDEYKSKPIKRKDGNPLLGVGYKDDDAVFNNLPTTRRIPPGGYSKGLW